MSGRFTTASCRLPADHRPPWTSWSCLRGKRASRQRPSAMDSAPRNRSIRFSDGAWRSRRPKTTSSRWSSGCGPMFSTWPTLAPCTPSSMRTLTTASGWTFSTVDGKTIWRCDGLSVSCWIFSLTAAAPLSWRIHGTHDYGRWTSFATSATSPALPSASLTPAPTAARQSMASRSSSPLSS